MADLAPEIWGLFFSAFISSTLAPGGSEVLLAYLVSNAQFSTLALVAVATIGNTMGAMTTWFLGFLIATKVGSERVKRSLSEKSVQRLQTWGAWALLFSWLPVLGDGLCLAAGWLRLGVWRCLAAIIIGKAVRYAAIAYLFAHLFLK